MQELFSRREVRPLDVIVVGNLNIDITAFIEAPPPPDSEVEAHIFNISFGGSAANLATALSKLSCKVGLVAHIGSDELGKTALMELKREGVYTSYIHIEKGQTTGFVVVIVERSGVKRMIAFRGANSFLSSRSLPLRAARRTYIVHASSVKPSIANGIASKALKGKAIFTYDPGGAAIKYKFKDFQPVLEKTKILFLNKTEAESLTSESDPRRVADLLLDYVPVVVVKLGAQGVYASYEGEDIHVPAFEVDMVIDTTGAGDAFNAGFLKGLLLNLPLRECCLLGNAVAAMKITAPGARGGLPTLQQLSEFLRSRGVIIEKLP